MSIALSLFISAGHVGAAESDKIAIGLIGDSTVATTYGWGPAFAGLVNDRVTVLNYARNGATLGSLSGKLDALLKTKPDYVIIQFGHNDMKRYDAGAYAGRLKDYVERIKKAGSKPIIFSSVTRRNFDENGQIKSQAINGHTLPMYALAAKAVAKETQSLFLDLNTISIAHHNKIGPKQSAAYNFNPTDTTHFSKKGAEKTAALIFQGLEAIAPKFAHRLGKRDYEIAVQRETPAKWKKLVPGGQFMDRILPAPIHDKLTSDTWGADGVRPRDIHNGIEDPKWSYWGGKPVLGPDGRYHWFGCRWPEGNPKGHGGWPQSEMIRAIGDRPTGPFVFENIIGPGHFPEIIQLPDNSWVLYHLHGYYRSETLDGPWTHVTKQEDGFPKNNVHMGSICLREDGSLLMICRISNIYVKELGSDVWKLKSKIRINPKHMYGWYEDPVVWRTEVQYHMIINDWQGRLAYHQRSADGITWKSDPGLAYTVGIDRYKDGTRADWFKYERPKVMQDKYGRPTHLYLAVIDVPKEQDKGNDNHSSKNIAIPLVPERRLRVLNTKSIGEKTDEIRVKILAEKGFDPHVDLDLDSLRFGAAQEVDYGRGSTLKKTQPDGKDSILVFDGKGNGITPAEFAGKLLGKNSDGDLLIGRAKLPAQQKNAK